MSWLQRVLLVCGWLSSFGCSDDAAAGTARVERDVDASQSGSGGAVDGALPTVEPLGRGTECDLPLYEEQSAGAGLEGSGWHRIYAQGGDSEPNADGTFGMTERRTLLVPGDHFVVGVGSFAEWTYPVLAPLAGGMSVHVARFTGADKDAGSVAPSDGPAPSMLLEIYLVHEGQELELLADEAVEPGDMGYSPYQHCLLSAGARSIQPGVDTHLLLRATNASGGQMGIVVGPPDYMTWIDVLVQ